MNHASAADYDQPSALLPTDPPARALRWSGWVLLTFTLATGLFVCLVRLPVAVSVPFQLQSVAAADDLQAPINGELLSIAINVGDTVSAGQLLFEIKSSGVAGQRSQLRQLQERQVALQASVERALVAYLAASEINKAELRSAQSELRYRSETVAAQRDLVARAEKLGSSGVVAEVDFLKYRLALTQAETEHSKAARGVDQLNLGTLQRQAEHEQLRGELASNERLLSEQISTAEAALADSPGDHRQVRAPYAGTVLTVHTRTPGSVLRSGDRLAQIAPGGSPLKARLRLDEAALPRLAVGQVVRLQLDAFPYQRYGSVDARLGWISQGAVVIGNQRAFVADAQLGASELQLRPGMRGRGRIIIDRRTLLQRALEPLRAVAEQLR